MDSYRKCFVPTCGNDSVNSPNKIIVRIRDDLREAWCREANADYFKIYTMYCCEDHFNAKEDLKNYYGCKVFNQEPVLKPTAILRNIASNLETETPLTPQSENSELYQLLVLNQSKVLAKKRKHVDINMPSTSTSTSATSTFPAKVSVHTQCNVKTADKGTNYKAKKMQPKPASAHTSLTPETVSPSKHTSTSPSLFGGTSGMEEDSTSENKSIQQLSKWQLFIDAIRRKPKMYLGLPKHYLWVIDNIVEKSQVPTSSLCLYRNIRLFFNRNPQASTRAAARLFHVSQYYVWQLLNASGQHPYHFQPVQDLMLADYAKRRTMSQWLLENLDTNILWTDEATFIRIGLFNSHNEHWWSGRNPHVVRKDAYQVRFSLKVVGIPY